MTAAVTATAAAVSVRSLPGACSSCAPPKAPAAAPPGTRRVPPPPTVRTVATVSAAVASIPDASHGEAGEERMRLQALLPEELAASLHRGRGGAR